MARCIMVLGVGRSGTSAVAGALHKLGVNMGDSFVITDHTNPHGTFEDEEVFNLTRQILKGDARPDDYRPLVSARDEKALWGLKDPALAHVAHYIWPLAASDMRVIVVRRPRPHCVNSFMRAYMSGRYKAEEWYDQTSAALAARLMEFAGPVLHVDFDVLRADREPQVRRLMHFAFEGLDMPGNTEIVSAITHVKSHIPRQRPQDWGSLAVGVRIGKHPEALWVASWSLLLSGGLRRSDTLLVPQMYQPAHWAANHMARDFLKTGKDTLVMVDDDHEFDMNIITRMRENVATWEYDVLSALTVRRQAESPSPILMKLRKQPDEPESLKGDSFYKEPPLHLGEVEEVDAVGLAMTFVKRHVLEVLVNERWGLDHTYDFFRPEDFAFEYGPGMESDDIPFSRRCRENGFRMCVDTNAQIKHIATVSLGVEDYLEKKRREAQDDSGQDTADRVQRGGGGSGQPAPD